MGWRLRDHRTLTRNEDGRATQPCAPRNEFEIELFRFLARDNEHVSYERVCSGIGLINCYRFLASLDDGARLPPDAAALSAAATDGSAETAGAEAGNLALKTLATGGVYLGGGIPPKILPKLREGGFLQAFLARGRFAPLLERVPVGVILNDRAAWIGAALAAAFDRRLTVSVNADRWHWLSRTGPHGHAGRARVGGSG